MKSNIFIPEKINVGFQERKSTYTGKLAYIIYFDEKGKLRKETSWNGWRDEKIDNEFHENVPTSGFVLNKKAGDYVSHWNHRQAYVRVYDPRGFEFEITIENLLYILENANSIKGKGLEGEFVYSWDGKELLLLPVDSPDYKEIKKYTDTLNNNLKLKGKDLKLGGTYLTKDNEEWIYLGRFNKWETDYKNKYTDENGQVIYPDITKGKAYFFKKETSYGNGIEPIKTLNKFISVVLEECVENYADLMDTLERTPSYSPIDETKNKYLPLSFEEFKKKLEECWWGESFYVQNGGIFKISLNKNRDLDSGIHKEIREEFIREGWMNSRYKDYRIVKEDYESLQAYELEKPHRKVTYLQNGKVYSEGY